jgi:hypothetical protein
MTEFESTPKERLEEALIIIKDFFNSISLRDFDHVVVNSEGEILSENKEE